MCPNTCLTTPQPLKHTHNMHAHTHRVHVLQVTHSKTSYNLQRITLVLYNKYDHEMV